MKTSLLLLLTFILAVTVTQAELVVNYNNPTSPINPARAADASTTSSHTWNFSDSALLFDGDAANGQKVYGGYTARSSALNGITDLRMTSTSLVSQTTKTGSGSITGRTFLMYNSADFLGHTLGDTYTFDQTVNSSFTNASVRLNNGGSAYVIRNGSDYWISNTATPTVNVSGTSNGTQLLWAPFIIANWVNFGQLNPGTSQGLNLGYNAASFTAQTFTNVTGVGFIAQGGRGGANGLTFSLTDLQVNLVSIKSSQSSTRNYVANNAKLTVYSDVPGHQTSIINGYASRAKSDIYEIWVRSAASGNQWVQCFANMTYNRASEIPRNVGFNQPSTGTSSHAYQLHTAGWTHTYANIEMSENSPVEVEIRKIGNTTLDGSSVIVKSAVHPAQKIIAGSKKDENGRVYFKINKPCQLVIDINGQMDDHNAAYPSSDPNGSMPDESPVHSVSFYANPIMEKPVASLSNRIVTVNPIASSSVSRLIPPDPATYDTLVFAPGVHNVGPGFKVHPGKNYYIPGDAIVYGNLTNNGVDQRSFRCTGDRINIYGYGTISGIQIPHYQNQRFDDQPTGTPNPEYPEWFALPEADRGGSVGIDIENAWDVKITGVTTIDPANFNTKFDGFLQRENDQSMVSWVKLHSWRVNGDGFGGYAPVEDSFFRTSDDATYIRDWRRRCTFWKDTNANIFRFNNYVSGGLDDCDILYSRWRATGGVGSVFEFAGGNSSTDRVAQVDLVIKDIRFHDRLSNPRCVFAMDAPNESYSNVKFENLSIYLPKNGRKNVLKGRPLAPWYGYPIFKNVTFQHGTNGTAPVLLNDTNFNTYFDTNEYADFLLFDDPRSLTLALNTDAQTGRIIRSPDRAVHPETSEVTLTAVAKPGYTFTGWSGDVSGNVNPTIVRMTDAKSVTANFALASISIPVVIDRPDVGTWIVPVGVYSATFEAWGGGGAGGSSYQRAGTQSSPITANTTARAGGGAGASYSRKTLTVTPGQTITYSVGAGGVASPIGFTHGSDAPEGGSSFANLGSTAVILSQAGRGGKNAVAFNNNVGGAGSSTSMISNIGEFTYTGGSGGASTSNGTGGGGGSAGADGNGENGVGPSGGAAGPGGGVTGAGGVNGFTLPGISGTAPGAGGSGSMIRNVALDQDEAYRAGGNGGDGRMVVTYNTMSFQITTQAVNGTVSLSPSGGTYLSGSSVNVTASPNAGFVFTGWSGDLTGSARTTNILVDRNKSVTANFSSTADPFIVWAGAGVNFAVDVNNDGLAEGLAWFLGASQPQENARNRLPKPAYNAGALVLEFDCLSGADRGTVIFEVQHSSDLGGADAWSGTPIPGTIGNFTAGVVKFVVTDPEPAGGLLKVKANIPAAEAAAGRVFGRIKGIKSSSP